MERQKIEVIVVKYQKARGMISSSMEKEEDYENDIGDEIDPN